MAKAKARKAEEPPDKGEEIPLAHTGKEGFARLKDFARVVVNVPKSEIDEADRVKKPPH